MLKNGSTDFEILVTILRDLEKLLRGKADGQQHSRHIQQSSDDDDSDDEHERSLKRRLQSIRQVENNKESRTHGALDQLIRQKELASSDSDDSDDSVDSKNQRSRNRSDSENEDRNKRSRNRSDSESNEDRNKRARNRSDSESNEDRNNRSQNQSDSERNEDRNVSQSQTVLIEKSKQTREKSNLASFNNTPPDLLIPYSKTKNKNKTIKRRQ